MFASTKLIPGFADGAFHCAWLHLLHEAFDAFAVALGENTVFFRGWQGDEIAGDEKPLIHAGGGEFDFGCAGLRPRIAQPAPS